MGPVATDEPTEVKNSLANHRLLTTHGVDSRFSCFSSPNSTPADGMSNWPTIACGCPENRSVISLRNDVEPTAIVTVRWIVMPSFFAAATSPGTSDVSPVVLPMARATLFQPLLWAYTIIASDISVSDGASRKKYGLVSLSKAAPPPHISMGMLALAASGSTTGAVWMMGPTMATA